MRSRNSIRLISAFVLIFSTIVVVYAQGANTLQGRALLPGGAQPNAPVKITLTLSGRRIYETFTDLSGRFTFTGLSSGTYQLTAEGDGQTFQTTSVYADVTAFGGSPQLFTQDIQLRPIAAKPMGQIGVINAFTQNVPKSAREAFERAAKLSQEQKPEAAAQQMMEAIRLFPDYFDAHLELGNSFLKAGRYEQAIAELDRAREINPNDERVYQSFGLVLMKLKNYPVAVAIFGEAARLNPSNPMNAVMKATAMIHQATTTTDSQSVERQSLLDGAALSLSQASKLSGDKVKADSLTLATFYEMRSEPGRAADELESYLKKADPKHAPTLQTEIKRLRAKAKDAKQ